MNNEQFVQSILVNCDKSTCIIPQCNNRIKKQKDYINAVDQTCDKCFDFFVINKNNTKLPTHQFFNWAAFQIKIGLYKEDTIGFRLLTEYDSSIE